MRLHPSDPLDALRLRLRASAASRVAFLPRVPFLLLFGIALLSPAERALAANTPGPEEARFLSRARRLTFEGARAGEGYFSADGRRMVFQSEREAGNPFYQIYVLDLTTGDQHRVSTGLGKTTCPWFHPSGDRVLFASSHLDPLSLDHQKAELELRASGKERRYAWDYDPSMELFEAPADGSGAPRRLTNSEGYDAEGSWSPDGRIVVFCSTRSAYPLDRLSPEDRKLAETDISFFGELYRMDADGANVRRLTDAPGYDGGPFFSADGSRVVWRRFDEFGMNADVHSMTPDGGDERRVTDFGSMSWAPFFHPSGDYLVFASNKLGFSNFEIFLVDAAGEKEPVRVTHTEGFDGLPTFSPDGALLSWTSQRHGDKGGQIYLARWNDAAAREALAAAPPRVENSKIAKANPHGDPHGAGGGDGTSAHATDDSRTKGATDAGGTPAHRGAAHPDPADAFPAGVTRKPTAEIAEDEIRFDVETLASEKMDGRLTGTEGERLATEYAARRFADIGLLPLPGRTDFFEPFEFISGVEPGPGNALSAVSVEANPHKTLEDRLEASRPLATFAPETDFRPLAFSDSITTEGLVAFAGYGLFVPGESGAAPAYDSWGDLDVTGRVVIVLRYLPEAVAPEVRSRYLRFAGLRFKALEARQRGAAAMLVVNGPNTPEGDVLAPLDLDMGGSTAGFITMSVHRAVAEKLLAGSGKTLKELQDALDDGTKSGSESFALEDVVVRVAADLKTRKGTGRNVVGVLPPLSSHSAATEYIAFGAHIDHLGRGAAGRTLAHADEQGQVHHGADDNASGVAALLQIAEAMAAASKTSQAPNAPRARGAIFGLWSGEELGLLGSAHFVRAAAIPPERIVAYLNMDMVGRLRDDALTVQGVGSAPEWKSALERRNVPAGFALSLTDDPYLPTDSTSFYAAGVPTLHFFTNAHDDYHRPSDTADKVNLEGVARVAEFVMAIGSGWTGDAPRPTLARVERKASQEGSREGLRAYVGTIPDYASEGIVGVKLSGTRPGGPADKAGLRAGDIIVEFAGSKIADIYEYTHALESVRIGEPIKVVVERGAERIEVALTPEARK